MTQLTDDYRRTIALNGPWEFTTDPKRRGDGDGWHEPASEWPDRAESVEIPHAWQEHDAHREYTGVAWYRRSVSLGTPEAEEVLLRFGAVGGVGPGERRVPRRARQRGMGDQ
ncbi:MAG: hypothetical protein QXG03_11640, partial [Halalkalicoccus sp.]